RARRATARYMRPVFTYGRSSARASARASVLLPAPAGPSIATTVPTAESIPHASTLTGESAFWRSRSGSGSASPGRGGGEARDPVEARDLLGAERSSLPRREPRVADGSDPDPYQSRDRVAEDLEHPADLALAPLSQDHEERGPAAAGLEHGRVHGLRRA